MIIGYVLKGSHSNGGDFFTSYPPTVVCQYCGTALDSDYCPREMRIEKTKKFDVSFTDDLHQIYSAKFVDFCKQNFGIDMHEKRIETPAGTYYYYVPAEILPYDSEDAKVDFIRPCAQCGGFEEVIGAYPVFLQERSIIKTGIFRTDLEFGSFRSKNFITIIGVEWYEILKNEKFKGIAFKPIHDDPWVEINKKLAKLNKK